MGNPLFGIDIAQLVADNIGPGVLPLTLVKREPGSRTPGSLSAGTNPTTTSHTGRGFISDYSEVQIGQQAGGGEGRTLVQRGDRRVIILGNTLSPAAVPEPGDRVTIEGDEYSIVNVMRDPAAATYTCQVRG